VRLASFLISIVILSAIFPAQIPARLAQSSTGAGHQPSQTAPQEQEDVVRLRSRLIVVPVSASDSQGRPVRDLTVDDFIIEEEGQTQKVVSLGEPGKTPLEIALLFDISGSVQHQFEFEQQAAVRFLREVLKPKDTASLFSIGQTPKIVKERTTSIEELVAGLGSLEARRGEPTAFIDSVVDSAQYLGRTPDGGSRKVLIVISDGEENHSKRFKLPDALRELQKNDCLFYSINPSGPAMVLNRITLKGQSSMESMSSQTGGMAFVPNRIEELEAVFRQIATELQAQYLFGYYSSDERTDGGFRRITVRAPKRVDLRVRARQGYYAPKA
jgi:Ca-activated chloride channel family protein